MVFGSKTSGGGSKSQTKFPEKFLSQFFSFFPDLQGGATFTPGDKFKPPGSTLPGDIIPDAEFVRPPADTGDKLRESIVNAALPTVRREFETQKGILDEDLNRRGIASSPFTFAKGTPRDRLTQQFNDQVTQIASTAALEGVRFDEREALRETGFNVTQFNQRLNEILGFLGIVTQAGRTGKTDPVTSASGGISFSGSGNTGGSTNP